MYGATPICNYIIFTVNVGTRVVIIGCVVEKPGHVRKVSDGLNATDKLFHSMLRTPVQLPGVEVYDTHIEIHTSSVNTYISIARELQKNLLDPSRKNSVMDQGKYIKWASQQKWTLLRRLAPLSVTVG